MSQTTQDLWPDDIAVVGDLKPPLVILREQASLLGSKTNNLVEGRVVTNPAQSGYFRHSFIVDSPALAYTYTLFHVSHPPELYPALITDDNGNSIGEAGNKEAFVEQLKKALSSDKTKRIITALIAQVQGTVAA
jgi:hypothetical protein